jgi:hypothetical protein
MLHVKSDLRQQKKLLAELGKSSLPNKADMPDNRWGRKLQFSKNPILKLKSALFLF